MAFFLKRLRFRVFIVGAAFAFGAAACSMHPLPEEFSRASTVNIVTSIRCEARAGVLSFSGAEWAKAEPIINATTVGYDYVFDIQETNAINGAGADAKKGFTESFLTVARPGASKENSFFLDATASAEFDRRNQRRFKVIEKLTDLLTPDTEDSCAGVASRKNWTYPIAGKIGMDEVIRTYIRLEMLTELQKRALKDDNKDEKKRKDIFPTKKNNIVFSDDITFTTKLQVGGGGTLVLDAVVGRLRVTNASITAAASRTDTHSVIVAMARSKIDVNEQKAFVTYRNATKVEKMVAAKALSDGKVVRAELLKAKAIHDPRSQALLIQIDEDGATQVAMEMDRRRSLNEPDNEPVAELGQRFLDVLKVP